MTTPLFTICVIARNEAKHLPRLFASLAEFRARGGRVVVVDTGSTDDTVEVATQGGADVHAVGDEYLHVIDAELAAKINARFIVEGEESVVAAGDTLFDFAAARNAAADFALTNMVAFADADEAYTRLDVDRINDMIRAGVESFEYHFVFSHDGFGNPAIAFKQSKFYDRRKLRWRGIIHEVLMGDCRREFVDKDVIYLEHWQNHETDRTGYLRGLALDCYLHPAQDRQSHYFARELLWRGRPQSALREFERHLTMGGWVAERAQSLIFMGQCHAALGDPEAEVECYARAFALDSSRREPLIALARAFQRRNDPKAVAAYAAAALEIPYHPFYANDATNYGPIPHELLYWARGWMGDIPGARRHILEALRHRPNHLQYLHDTRYYFDYPDPLIDGWMRYPEMLWLRDRSREMGTVVELGSWKGRSTHALASGGARITAVDTFAGSPTEGYAHAEAKTEDIEAVLRANLSGFDNVEVFRGTTEEAAAALPDADMVFVDAGHTYDDVVRDIRLWRPKCRSLLCGHDFADQWPEVRRAVVDELGEVQVHESIWYKWIGPPPRYNLAQNVITGWCSDEELTWLFERAREARVVVEVGCWKGRSTHALLAGTLGRGEVHAIDHWLGSADPEETGHADVFSEFLANLGSAPHLRIHRGSSVRVAEEFENRQADLIYIDAGHQYQEVLDDLRAWQGKVRHGGILCGHDYDSEPVARAVHEVFGSEVQVGPGKLWWVLVDAETAEEVRRGIVTKLEAGERVIFAKCGDGEQACMFGESGANCDGQVYSPALAAELRMAFALFHQLSGRVVRFEHQESYNALLHRSDRPWPGSLDEMRAFYGAIRDCHRYKVLVGSAAMREVAEMLLADWVEVPRVDAFAHRDEITPRLLSRVKPDALFLFAAGPAAKVLMADVLRADASCSVIDIGSAFDPLVYGQTRTYQLSGRALELLYLDWLRRGPLVSIVIPTLDREEKLRRLLELIPLTAGYTRYEVIIERDDPLNRQGVARTLAKGVARASGEVIAFLGDDCVPHRGWLLEAMRALLARFPDTRGLVALNDGVWQGEVATHFVAGRCLLDDLGGHFFDPAYHHVGADNELTERCKMLGRFASARGAYLFHDHPLHHRFTEPIDEGYRVAWDEQKVAEDRALLTERLRGLEG